MTGALLYRQTEIIGIGNSYVDVTLDHSFPDDNYVVGVELSAFEDYNITNQINTGFRFNISSAPVYSTQPVSFTVYHE